MYASLAISDTTVQYNDKLTTSLLVGNRSALPTPALEISES